MDQLKQQSNYQYQRKIPLPLQNVTQSYQNVNRYQECDDSPISASGNHSFSTKNQQKFNSNSNSQKQNSILSSQEIVSKYNNFLLSTKSACRSSTQTIKKCSYGNIDFNNDQHETRKQDENQKYQEGISTNCSQSKSPIRSLLNENNQTERTKSEERNNVYKNTMNTSKSSCSLAISQQQDQNIQNWPSNSTNEFKMQLIRKLGELEIELKKEHIKNQNLQNENKKQHLIIQKLQEQFKLQTKDNSEYKKTIESLNKEIAEHIKLQLEEEQNGQQQKKLKQILEKTDIEQKLSKECDRLTEIVEDKENQINKWMERFMNLKESKKDQVSARDQQIEKQQSFLKQQIQNDQIEYSQLKKINNQLIAQIEDMVKEKEKSKLSNQMLQEQLQQNTQIIHSQQAKLQDIDNHFKNNDKNKKSFEQKIDEIQKIKEDLEQKVIELEQQNEELAYKNRELKNQQQKSEKLITSSKQKYEDRIQEYQSVLQDLRIQIDKLNAQSLEQKSTIKVKIEELNTQNDQISQLKEQIKQLSGDLSEKNDKIIKYSKKESQEKLKQLGFTQPSEIEQLRLKTRLQELEQELYVQRCDYDRLISKISEIQKQNDELVLNLQSQEKSHQLEIEELEKGHQQSTKQQIEREIKKVIVENERNKNIYENQTKQLEHKNTQLEKQVQSYKDKLEDIEVEMASQLKDRHEQIQQLKDLAFTYKKQLDQNQEIKDKVIKYEDEMRKIKKLNEELQSQLNQLQELQVQSKEKEEQQKHSSLKINELQRSIELLQIESKSKQLTQKESEKKLHDKVQEAIQKFNRDLRLKDQDIQFFEKENENLNRIITQQKMTINQLQNRVQKNIGLQNEEELLKKLGLNELFNEKNKSIDTEFIDKQSNLQEEKSGNIFNQQYIIQNQQKIEQFMNKQLSLQKFQNMPSFRDEQKQLSQKTTNRNLGEGNSIENLPTSGTWNNLQDVDNEWRIERQELSNWSHDDQIIEKLQDHQQISFSLRQQCFQHDQVDASDVQSDVEEFHIPLYQN